MSSKWAPMEHVDFGDWKKACFSLLRGEHIPITIDHPFIVYLIPDTPKSRQLVRAVQRVTDVGTVSTVKDNTYPDETLAFIDTRYPPNYVLMVVQLLRLCQEGGNGEGTYLKNDFNKAWDSTKGMKNALKRLFYTMYRCHFNSNHRTVNSSIFRTIADVDAWIADRKMLRELYTGSWEKSLYKGHGYQLPTHESWGIVPSYKRNWW